MATLYFDLQWHKWHTINVDIAANYLSEAGKEFEAWLVDDAYVIIIVRLRLCTAYEHRYSNNSKAKIASNLSPLAFWSNAVSQTWLIPPFGR